MYSQIGGLRLVRAGVLLCFFTAILGAQPSNGYVFFAPGGLSCCHNTAMTLQLGAGGEAVFGKGIGAGAEIGALWLRRDLLDSVMGVFSANGYYHFVHAKDEKVDPFVTGGYTVLFRSGHSNLANFGVGLNYWFHSRLGARVEFRDQLNTTGSIAHFWGVRFGLAFH